MSARSVRRPAARRFDWMLPAFVVAVILYLLTPILTAVLASFTQTSFIVFPPRGLTLAWYRAFLFGHQYWAAIGRSLITAFAAVVLTIAIGIPASYGLVRYRFPGRDWINMATLTPIIIPEMVIAIALLLLFTGIGVRPSLPLLITGHTVLTLPFMIRAISASLQGLDATTEEAARGLGASPLRAFLTVTFPLIRTGLFAGAMFVFVISMDLFLVSMFLSQAYTLPVEMWWTLRFASQPTVLALASLMIAMIIPTIALIAKLVGLESFIGIARA
jgi:putative spermidine/putrescine transport system permease protein